MGCTMIRPGRASPRSADRRHGARPGTAAAGCRGTRAAATTAAAGCSPPARAARGAAAKAATAGGTVQEMTQLATRATSRKAMNQKRYGIVSSRDHDRRQPPAVVALAALGGAAVAEKSRSSAQVSCGSTRRPRRPRRAARRRSPAGRTGDGRPRFCAEEARRRRDPREKGGGEFRPDLVGGWAMPGRCRRDAVDARAERAPSPRPSPR